MKEPAKGAIGRATDVAEGVAAGGRRRQREREPRVLRSARPGQPRILAPGAKGQDRMLELASEMVALVDEVPVESRRAQQRRERREERQAG